MTTNREYQQTRPLRPETGRSSNAKRSGLLANIGKTIHDLLMLVFRLAKWITGPGKGVLMGLLGFYFLLVGAENYWQSWYPGTLSFIPKPFINDGANLALIPLYLLKGGFWFSFAFASAINALQSAWMRENRSIRKMLEKHQQVASIKTPEKQPGSIWMAQWTRNQIRNYGRKTIRAAGIAVMISYLIDISNGFMGFPIVGVAPHQIIINAVWICLSVFGSELAWSFI